MNCCCLRLPSEASEQVRRCCLRLLSEGSEQVSCCCLRLPSLSQSSPAVSPAPASLRGKRPSRALGCGIYQDRSLRLRAVVGVRVRPISACQSALALSSSRVSLWLSFNWLRCCLYLFCVSTSASCFSSNSFSRPSTRFRIAIVRGKRKQREVFFSFARRVNTPDLYRYSRMMCKVLRGNCGNWALEDAALQHCETLRPPSLAPTQGNSIDSTSYNKSSTAIKRVKSIGNKLFNIFILRNLLS